MECALDADEQRSSRSSMLCSVVQLRARAAADFASAFDVKTRGHEPSPSAACIGRPTARKRGRCVMARR